MPFDPTLPLPDSDIESAVLRDQFNALNDKIDTLPHVTPTQLAQAMETAALNPTSVGPFTGGFSDPPTQSEMYALADWIEQLRVALRR